MNTLGSRAALCTGIR